MKLLNKAQEEFVHVQHPHGPVAVSTKTRMVGGNVLVFLHGLGCAKECFADAFKVRRLKQFSICTLDFPGHGASGRWPGGHYSLQAYADVTVEVVRRLRPNQITFVCHSMGGAVGLLALQELGAETFVSVEGNLVAEDCSLVSRQAAERSVADFTKDDFRRFHSALVRSSRMDLQAWGHWYGRCDPVAIHGASRSLVEWSDSGKLAGLFKSARQPSYVFGAESTSLEHLADVLAGIPTYPVEGSGHFPMVDRPDLFWSTIADLTSDGGDKDPSRVTQGIAR